MPLLQRQLTNLQATVMNWDSHTNTTISWPSSTSGEHQHVVGIGWHATVDGPENGSIRQMQEDNP